MEEVLHPQASGSGPSLLLPEAPSLHSLPSLPSLHGVHSEEPAIGPGSSPGQEGEGYSVESLGLAWHLRRAVAWALLPLASSHLGDSGVHSQGITWSNRHGQLQARWGCQWEWEGCYENLKV